MRKGNIKDRQKVVKIIEESFVNSPSVDWVVDPKKRKEGLKVLAKFAFDLGLKRKGVYLSDDEEAIAICIQESNKVSFIYNIYQKIKLLIGAIGFRKISRVLKRQAYFKAQRPQNRDFLYFWFFGASNSAKGKGSAYDLQKEIFDMANKNNLPIYIETSMRKNKVVYQRFGFEVYHTWHVEEENIDMWFMKREPVV